VPPSAAAGPVTPGASGSPAGAGASPAAGGDQIVVDVAGRVRHPGIAVLPAGSRVVDAVRAAGGVRPGVDRSTVNLARPLTDGEQVLVGVSAASGTAGGAAGGSVGGGAAAPAPSTGASPPTLVNINTADQTTLETLPGVGPVTAQAILQWRSEHGGFTSVDELLEVSGIGDATLAKIAPYVTL
jgi:competence protein ComEA